MGGMPIAVKIVPVNENKGRASTALPRRLDEVLMRLPVLTHATAVVGVGEDGVPVLWDAQHGKSILVIGEGLVLPWQVLDAARVSLEGNNTRHVLEITWVTERETRGRGITDVVSPHERTLEQTLRRLADLVDRRRHGQNRGATQVLILDDLAQVLKADYEAHWALEYLVKNGGQGDLAVLAAVERSAASRRPLNRWVTWFKGTIVQEGMGFCTKQGRVVTVEI